MQPNMQKYQLSEDEIKQVLEKTGTGVIATVYPDGRPYATPIHYIVLDGRIFFHGRKQGDKVSNIENDPRCSLAVMQFDGFERTGDMSCNTTTVYRSNIEHWKVVQLESPSQQD